MVCRSITSGSSITSIPPSEAATGFSCLTSMPTEHSFKHGTKTRTALVFGVATRRKFPRGEREPKARDKSGGGLWIPRRHFRAVRAAPGAAQSWVRTLT